MLEDEKEQHERTEKVRPIKVFRLQRWARGTTIAVWKNAQHYSFTISRQVKQPDGTYKNSCNFFQQDLGALYFLIGEALRWLMQQEQYQRMPDQMYDDNPDIVDNIGRPLVGRNGDDTKLLARYQEHDNEE